MLTMGIGAYYSINMQVYSFKDDDEYSKLASVPKSPLLKSSLRHMITDHHTIYMQMDIDR